MKDYSTSAEERNEFILSYKIKKDRIFIKLPRERRFINLFKKNLHDIPYTEENEQTVIERMENQVEKADGKRFEHGTLRLILFIGALFANIPIFIFVYTLQLNLFIDLILSTCLGMFLMYIAFGIGEILESKKKDLEKSKFFIENQETINKYLGNANAKKNLSRKTRTKIEKVKASGKPFNINDIDKLSLNDLKQLKANIDRILSFGFDEGTTTKEQGHQKVINR